MSHPSDALKGEEPADTHGLHAASRRFPGSLTFWLELQCRGPGRYLVASTKYCLGPWVGYFYHIDSGERGEGAQFEDISERKSPNELRPHIHSEPFPKFTMKSLIPLPAVRLRWLGVGKTKKQKNKAFLKCFERQKAMVTLSLSMLIGHPRPPAPSFFIAHPDSPTCYHSAF